MSYGCSNHTETKQGGLNRITDLIIRLVIVLFLSVIFSTTLLANPEGGEVSAGSATITSPSANVVQVNQTSNKAVVDWRSFNISPSEETKFVQPSANAIILNRINPANGASNILGKLSANGQVWLLNPAGIYFGSSAVVNVAGFVCPYNLAPTTYHLPKVFRLIRVVLVVSFGKNRLTGGS